MDKNQELSFLGDFASTRKSKTKTSLKRSERTLDSKKLATCNANVIGTILLEMGHGDRDVNLAYGYLDEKEFIAHTETRFSNFKDVVMKRRRFQGRDSMVLPFETEKFRYEIFAQKILILR